MNCRKFWWDWDGFTGTARLASVYFALSICVSRWPASLTSLLQRNIYDKYGGSFFLFCLVLRRNCAVRRDGKRCSKSGLFGPSGALWTRVCAISFTLGQALLLRDTAHLVPSGFRPIRCFFLAILTTIAFALGGRWPSLNRRQSLQHVS